MCYVSVQVTVTFANTHRLEIMTTGIWLLVADLGRFVMNRCGCLCGIAGFGVVVAFAGKIVRLENFPRWESSR